MFERPQRGERAVLLLVGLGHGVTEDDEQEFESLLETGQFIELIQLWIQQMQ